MQALYLSVLRQYADLGIITLFHHFLWPAFANQGVLFRHFKIGALGVGQNLGLVYAVNPRLSRYSMGLRELRVILIRFPSYQLM